MIPTHFSPTFWTLKIFQLVCSAELPFLQGYKLHCDAQLAKIRSVFQVLPGAQEGGEGTREFRGRNLTVKLVMSVLGTSCSTNMGFPMAFRCPGLRFSIWHNIWWWFTPIAFSVLQNVFKVEVNLKRTANLDGKSWWKEGFARHILEVTIFETLSEFMDADDKNAAGLSTPTCGIYVRFLVYIYIYILLLLHLLQVPDPEDILETSHIDLSHAEFLGNLLTIRSGKLT